MLDLLLTLLLILVGVIALVALLSAAFGAGLGVLAGRVAEALFELVVPRRRTGLGPEGVVGESGEVVSLATEAGAVREGMVQVGGELWKARAAAGSELRVGQSVEVVAMEKLIVVVEPLQVPSPRGASGRSE